MNNRNRRINMMFGAVVLALAAVAATAAFRNLGRPAILAPAADAGASGGALPETHPPVDALNEISTLLQMSRNDPRDPDLKIRLGNAYYDAGIYQEAIQAYEEGIALKPQGPEVQTDLATCYHYVGDNDRALELLNRVLAQQPDFAPALFNKGIVLQVGRNDPQGAVATWDELLRIHPDHPQRRELEQRMGQLRSTAK